MLSGLAQENFAPPIVGALDARGLLLLIMNVPNWPATILATGWFASILVTGMVLHARRSIGAADREAAFRVFGVQL
jgi:hypothetical protein